MKKLICRGLIVVLLAAASAVLAQTNDAPPVPLSSPPPPSLNRFDFSYRAGWGIQTGFKNVGRFGSSHPGPATADTDHTYDDGFNRVDSTGNNHFGTPGTW